LRKDVRAIWRADGVNINLSYFLVCHCGRWTIGPFWAEQLHPLYAPNSDLFHRGSKNIINYIP
jgi:hypothetical protein